MTSCDGSGRSTCPFHKNHGLRRCNSSLDVAYSKEGLSLLSNRVSSTCLPNCQALLCIKLHLVIKALEVKQIVNLVTDTIKICLALMCLLLLDLNVTIRGHHHLDFPFVALLRKWHIINVNHSFLNQSFFYLVLLIKNCSKGIALFQCMAFAPVVWTIPCTFLIYDVRKEFTSSRWVTKLSLTAQRELSYSLPRIGRVVELEIVYPSYHRTYSLY